MEPSQAFTMKENRTTIGVTEGKIREEEDVKSILNLSYIVYKYLIIRNGTDEYRTQSYG